MRDSPAAVTATLINHRLLNEFAQVVPRDRANRFSKNAKESSTLLREITLDDYRWLVEGEGSQWLEKTSTESTPLHQLTARLRRELSATQTHLVIEQHQLRRRAAKKFLSADRLFLTPLTLEQASDGTIADYKARRFPHRARVADLCCGIGGDLFGLALRGPTCGFDRDEIACYLAATNTRRLRRVDCSVEQRDVAEVDLSEFAAVHIDPDRRATGRRSVKLENHQPSRAVLSRIVEHSQHVAIKLAPATDPDDPLLQAAELEWIGFRRDCRQLVAWFGDLARHRQRRVATVIGANGPNSLVGEVRDAEMATQIGPYVFEPYPPVLAAHLAGQLAHQDDLEFVTPGGGYLTGMAATRSVFYASYKVLEAMPYRPKRVRTALRKLGVGRLIVKKRGVAHDPHQVQRECLPASGEQTAVLIVTHVQRQVIAIIAQIVEFGRDSHGSS